MMPNLVTCWPGGDQGFDTTIIEVMPMGDIGTENRLTRLPLSQVRADLAKRFTLTDPPAPESGALCEGRGNRSEAGLHHPADPQFLRKLQSCARHMYRQTLLCLGQDDNTDLRARWRAANQSDDAIASQ